MKRIFTTLMALAVMTAAFSQVLFEENFDDAQADTRWTVAEDTEGGDNIAEFFYDYVGAGIPAAPNGGGLGLRFQSNVTAGAASQVYAFPNGQSFSGRYRLAFDLWLATDTSGSGTTEFAIFGVMHTDQIIPSYNGVDYCFTSEGGSARDIRVYEEGIELSAGDGEGGYPMDAAGVMTQNMNNDGGPIPYQDDFEGDWPFGQWLAVAVEVTDEMLKFTVNDSVWSEMPNLLQEDGNITIGYMDIFSSIADPTGSMFGLYDNITVTYMPGVGVEDKEVSMVSVYPNPVADYLNVELGADAEFQLINSLGQQVLNREVEAGKTTISVEEVVQGVYFARFTLSNGTTEIHKVVVK